jgi:hypothetical protein
MKKIILNMLLLCGITVAAGAQAYDANPMANTPANQLENNAYYNNLVNNSYNEMYRSYWVWDKASFTWVKRVEPLLPPPPAVNNRRSYIIIGESNEVVRTTGTVTSGTKPKGQ